MAFEKYDVAKPVFENISNLASKSVKQKRSLPNWKIKMKCTKSVYFLIQVPFAYVFPKIEIPVFIIFPFE